MYRESSIHYPQDEMTTMMIPVTLGCPYNKCLFCTMYKDDKYSEVPLEQIRQQLINGYEYTEKVFLTGADPLCVGYDKMMIILKEIREYLPYCARVASYASVRSISRYSDEELSNLHNSGLRLLYIGFEAGSDKYLSLMNKGHTVSDAIREAKKLNKVNLAFNAIVLIGIGGAGRCKENAQKTVHMINQFHAKTLITMSLMLMEGSGLSELAKKGEYIPSSRQENLLETWTILHNLHPEKTMEFDTTHPSNIIKIKGILPQDRKRLLMEIDSKIQE
ncbi:radical SAM protein [Gudongella sp. DL1XJH-153]|uniref:radical SAM protein n=1 Tax=Gudongella sp. DL1XJH-153 TaxID=3409804 RepID=UPI003BB672BA